MLPFQTLAWVNPTGRESAAPDPRGHLRLLDQTRLPLETVYMDCRQVEELWSAVRRLVVRGAPAIGIAAAYGCVLGVRAAAGDAVERESLAVTEALGRTADYLATSRPTAVNLFWALERMKRVRPCTAANLLAEAIRIHEEDAAMCQRIGELALPLIERAVQVQTNKAGGAVTTLAPLSFDNGERASRSGSGPGEGSSIRSENAHRKSPSPAPSRSNRDGLPSPRSEPPGERGAGPGRVAGEPTPPSVRRGVLTHCNAGALATGGIGTATAGMYLAHEKGISLVVYADETRPLLQGARLTAFELGAAGIDVTLICDDMAAQVMRSGRVGLVITGADRIAANGDTANKIGTYNLAILARHHGLPFYVAAPSSTFDLSLADGSGIPIEERAAEEITEGFGRRTAPPRVKTYSPAFDVTPHELITGIITERGVIEPVNAENVARVVG